MLEPIANVVRWLLPSLIVVLLMLTRDKTFIPKHLLISSGLLTAVTVCWIVVIIYFYFG